MLACIGPEVSGSAKWLPVIFDPAQPRRSQMIDTSDVIFFLLGVVIGGGIMRWLTWCWYSDLFNPKVRPTDTGENDGTSI